MEDSRLSRDAIVAEALALLNEQGLEGLSLRKLAARLGVRAPSLYRHIPDKAALMASVLEAVFVNCLDAVPGHRHWRDWMQAFGDSIWQRLDELRDYGRLVLMTEISEEQVARTVERIRVRVRDLDMPEDDALRLQSSIQALLTGWSAFAHAPYADALGKVIPIRDLAMRDVRTLIEGYSRQSSD